MQIATEHFPYVVEWSAEPATAGLSDTFEEEAQRWAAEDWYTDMLNATGNGCRPSVCDWEQPACGTEWRKAVESGD